MAIINTTQYLTGEFPNLVGTVIISTSKVHGKAISCIVFYSNVTGTITNFKLFEGGSYYSELHKFTLESIGDSFLQGDSENIVLVQKNFVNDTFKTLAGLQNVSIQSYSWSDTSLPSVVQELRVLFRPKRVPGEYETYVEYVNSLISKKINLLKINHEKPYSPVWTKSIAPFTQRREYSSLQPQSQLNAQLKIVPTNFGFFHAIMSWGSILISPTVISVFLDIFWSEVVVKETLKGIPFKITLQLKLRFDNSQYRSITYLQTVGPDDLEFLRIVFLDSWKEISSHYKMSLIKELIIMYKFVSPNKRTRLVLPKSLRNQVTIKHKGYNTPLNMDYTTWGLVQNFKNVIKVFKYGSNILYEILVKNEMHIVYVFAENGVKIDSFVDTNLSNDPNDTLNFKREFSNFIVYVQNGKELYRESKKATSFLATIKKHKKLNKKVIAMDLETCNIQGKLVPIMISMTDDGVNCMTFTIKDHSSPERMLEAAVNYISQWKYNGWTVYFHNFAKFDGIFMMGTLADLSEKSESIIRDGQMLKFVFTFKNKVKLTILDSMLMLQGALDNWASSFKVDNKLKFPILFLNEDNFNLSYVGEVPGHKYFVKCTWEEYVVYKNSFKGKPWVLLTELVKYCEQDVKTLHHVISKASQAILERMGLDMTKYPTSPSLTLANYRANYLDMDMKIPLITGPIFNFISKAYYGGISEFYTPFWSGIWTYDVCSLYPYAMKDFPVPVGNPMEFEGDPYRFHDDPYGFFEVTVTSPDHLDKPLLPTKVKREKGGIVTMYPTGTWQGVYYSEELKNLLDLGYTFTVHRGVLFKKGYLFTDFVEDLFNLKRNSTKGSPWYLLAKLFMNSLYGRFGMDPNQLSHKIFDISELEAFEEKHNILDMIKLGKSKVMVTYDKETVTEKELNDPGLNTSIGIAAAISATARIIMTKYYRLFGDYILYIDTDGIKLMCPLPDHLVGNNLGDMAFEGYFKEGIFLSPKVYGLLSKDLKAEVKYKGVKDQVSYWILNLLLYKDVTEVIFQEKWFRELSLGTILIKQVAHTLQVNENKREIIWDSCGKFIGTRPYELQNGQVIRRKPFVLYYLNILSQLALLPIPTQVALLQPPRQFPLLSAPVQSSNLYTKYKSIISRIKSMLNLKLVKIMAFIKRLIT